MRKLPRTKLKIKICNLSSISDSSLHDLSVPVVNCCSVVSSQESQVRLWISGVYKQSLVSGRVLKGHIANCLLRRCSGVFLSDNIHGCFRGIPICGCC